MIQLNLLMDARAWFEDNFARKGDPSKTSWTKAELVMGLSLCENNHTRSDRLAEITAKILYSLPPEDRLNIQNEYPIPDNVLAVPEDTPWPDPSGTMDFSEVVVGDLEVIKARRVEALQMHIEKDASRIIKGGSRMVLTHTFQALEADQFLKEENPNPENFPHLMSYQALVGLEDLQVAAAQIQFRSLAWRKANAQIETYRVLGAIEIKSAETLTQVAEAFERNCSGVTQVVDALLALS